MERRSSKLAIVAILMMTAGCSTPEQSRLTGQIVGTTVGIVAGAQFGQGVGTLFVASHAAWLGFNLGELTANVLGRETEIQE
jgi:uncharacterized protein YcfJ